MKRRLQAAENPVDHMNTLLTISCRRYKYPSLQGANHPWFFAWSRPVSRGLSGSFHLVAPSFRAVSASLQVSLLRCRICNTGITFSWRA